MGIPCHDAAAAATVRTRKEDMNSPTKTFKRLGIVGAAAVVGLVPIGVLSTSAYAVAGTPQPTLSLSNTTPGNTTTVATNVFTTDHAVSAGGTTPGTITITPLATVGSPLEFLTTTTATVSFTPAGGTATPDPVTTSVAANGDPLVITLNGANAVGIPAGAAVTVIISNVTNPPVSNTTPSDTVFVSDTTSADTNEAAVNSTQVVVTTASSATPTVATVNPQAFSLGGGELFTVTGSGFTSPAVAGAAGPPVVNASPVVCFVLAGTTAPSSCSPTAVDVTGSTTVANVAASNVSAPTSTEVQATAPALTKGMDYNVVVYNYNQAAGAYTTASTTSASTLVAVSANAGLNFVPESGVRAVDSRIGEGLPSGALQTGVAETIPLATFENTSAIPTNVPAAPTAIALNVTAIGPSGAGNLQVWSAATCTTNADAASTVNFQAPQDTGNSTVLAVNGANVCIQDNGAAVNVTMDVTGYAASGGFAAPPAAPASPRLLDTRPTSQVGSLQGPLAGGTVYHFAPGNGLTAGDVVALNVTAVGPTSAGNLRVFPEPASGMPAASAVPNTAVDTYIPGTDGGSMVITQVGGTATNPYIDLYSDTAGTVNVVVDEIGSFPIVGTVGTTSSSVQAIAAPIRTEDTRPGPVAAGATTNVTVAPLGSGSSFIPANALAVAGSIADIIPSGPGYLVAFPGGETMPATSSINNYPMQTRSNNALVAINPSNGMISVANVGATTNFTFDATAYIQ